MKEYFLSKTHSHLYWNYFSELKYSCGIAAIDLFTKLQTQKLIPEIGQAVSVTYLAN